jgi:hypothetical protein
MNVWSDHEDATIVFFKRSDLLLYPFHNLLIKRWFMPQRGVDEIEKRYQELTTMPTPQPGAVLSNGRILPKETTAVDVLFVKGEGKILFRCANWSAKEENLLMSIKKTDVLNRLGWAEISRRLFPHRTSKQCNSFYNKTVKPKWIQMTDSERAAIPLFEHYEEMCRNKINATFKVEQKPRNHGAHVLDKYLRLGDWDCVAAEFDHRFTVAQLQTQLARVVRAERHTLRWTVEDVVRLRTAVNLYANNWAKISEYVVSKSPYACRKMWANKGQEQQVLQQD